MSFEAIGKLTDRQIYDVLNYPRDKDGSLLEKPRHSTELPDLPPTKENQRAALFAVGGAAGVPIEELERIWCEKWGE